jgi:hypothetical protein
MKPVQLLSFPGLDISEKVKLTTVKKPCLAEKVISFCEVYTTKPHKMIGGFRAGNQARRPHILRNARSTLP